MKKYAFLFAGQGAQEIGLAADFRNNAATSAMLDEAVAVLGEDYFSNLWGGSKEWITMTANAQPALFLHGVILAAYLQEKGVKPVASTGLSLGEYTALASAGALDFRAGLALVRKRGLLMGEAVADINGGMFALMGMDLPQLEGLLATFNAGRSADEQVYISNLNCPGQIVVAGRKSALTACVDELKAAGLKRAIELSVEGPFHTGLLNAAAEQFAVELVQADFAATTWPVYSNLDALTHTAADLPQVLAAQMVSTVRFEACLQQLLADGVEEFIEIGPGQVLTGFLRKIDKNIVCHKIGDLSEAEAWLAANLA